MVAVDKIPLKGAQRGERAGGGLRGAAGRSRAAAIRSAVENFHAVEHRLEFVATLNGVDYYNDSKATNVDAAAKAIGSFAGGIHLILGGKDKNSDYTQLSALLKSG
jgi:UDP-N-acetylmuramoylalanine--D-glutamate ligase